MTTRNPQRGPPRKRAKPTPAAKEQTGPVGERFARTTAPRALDDAERRAQWRLPDLDDESTAGPYIVELNAEHRSGLPGAAVSFLALHDAVLAALPRAEHSCDRPHCTEIPQPLRIGKSYYRCEYTNPQWHAIVAEDEKRALRERAIYRLWPDFPVRSHTDRSMPTIKADAALRSFDAAGRGITWAVVDSGVAAAHPHFGAAGHGHNHRLLCDEVRDLHRCFADISKVEDGISVAIPPLRDPDAEPKLDSAEREALLQQHRDWALRDEFGHGTHVAGIVAGQAPGGAAAVVALERELRVERDAAPGAAAARYAARNFDGEVRRPSGVAPNCRLVSLRVLDENGKGRASQIIQALEYIRERINDNPKVMRVHGVNLSVGYEFDAELFACGQSPLCTAVDRLVQEGVVVVAAAGNTGYGTAAAAVGASKMCLSNSINDPGNAAGAITVGATHRDAPHTYGVSYFSSKGPTGDGRLKPDLVAPGERITSCAAGRKLQTAMAAGGVVGDGVAVYVDDSGTSMAAPHVSGAVAAFLSIRREFIGRPQEVKRIFLASATPLGRERYFEGHGLVDLMRAIQSV